MGNFPKKPKRSAKRQEYSNAAVSSFPRPLSPEDEKYYINLHESGDETQKKQAKNMLVERNLRLVAYIVKKYNHPDTEDLISIGTIGLIKGIASFNSEKGTRLATYCSRCIENAIPSQWISRKQKLESVRLFKKNGAFSAT